MPATPHGAYAGAPPPRRHLNALLPEPDWAYRGWVGWGNLRANGHPSGSPWRQLLCVAWRRYFLETFGTLLHGKRTSPDLIVHVLGCLAEGLGIRGTARVFEVDPNTVLHWLV